MPEESGQAHLDEEKILRNLLEGTAGHTGPEFFAALVQHAAIALDVAGVWVTELSVDERELRALAFWFQDRYIVGYRYAIEGTPCEPVVQQCSLFHVPENVIELFPRDPDLGPLSAVSYLGIPLLDEAGAVVGHLAALDVRPLRLTPRIEALFRIFGARAGAEIRRLRADERIRERERQLSSVLDSAWDAILVVDEAGVVRQANRSGRAMFGFDEDHPAVPFASLLSEEGGARVWRKAMCLQDEGRAEGWINDLECRSLDHRLFPAEASISRFERDGRRYWTVILRDLHQQRAAERRVAALEEESRRLREEMADLRPVGQLIGESPAMREMFGQLRQVAPTDATVLIQGETGTGKELVARAIHEASPRKNRPMICVNCGAIPAALMESEFFGHEKGAFTGATERREGRFAMADGGTLFLDEIGELPLDLQVKLLRVLQESEFEPVGSARTRRVDVRIVAATNRDLAQEVERGRFRADLRYRLSVFPLQVPALRDRGDDVVLLAEAFLERLGRRLNRRVRALSRPVRDCLREYDWPGNVRELENVLERAAILSRGDEIVLERSMLPGGNKQAAPPRQDMEEGAVLTARQMEALERENLLRALHVCGWRVAGESGAARLLGLAPSTLSSRMKALGVVRSRERSRERLP